MAITNTTPLTIPAMRNAKGKQRMPKLIPPKNTRTAASLVEILSEGGGRSTECTALRHTETPSTNTFSTSLNDFNMVSTSLPARDKLFNRVLKCDERFHPPSIPSITKLPDCFKALFTAFFNAKLLLQ
mmetsp:Transcript_39931/g.94775  ORF Transcript_39931/g.94775 Transcript_39931/m.94775 type:complete len:128 (+) Transcript_39931:1040-1423(+)